jgi:hypothetical protein
MAPGKILKLAVRLKKLVPQFARRIYHTVRPQVIIMTGPEKLTNAVLHIVYVGNMPRNYRLGFPSQILWSIDDEVDLGCHWLWQLRNLVKAREASFALVESASYLQRFMRWLIAATGQKIFLPHYVHCFIRVEDMPITLKNNDGLKRDIRTVRDTGYTLQVSKEPARYREFLDDFYKPYLLAAHGSKAAVFNYDFLCREDYSDHDNWELQQVMLAEEWIAGCIVRKDGNTAYMLELGIGAGNIEAVRRGALAASYWLGVQRLRDLGYQKISFMWSPPFLKNGVLLFKKKYRPVLEPAPMSDKGLLLISVKRDELSRKILIEQPMIQLHGSRLKATRFVEKTEDMAAARQQLIKESRRYGGISDYEVIVLET